MTADAGGVAERSNAPVLKTGNGATRSRVRIPPPPLLSVLVSHLRYNAIVLGYKPADPLIIRPITAYDVPEPTE